MHIGVNGYYLTTPNSGVGQYSNNLLHALAKIDKENTYFVFCPKPIDWNLPENFKLKVIYPMPFFKGSFLNRFYWEEYQLGQEINEFKIQVFHGLYQSLPKGAEKIGNVVTIHDAIPWRFPFERKQFSYRWYSDTKRNLVRNRAKKVITISKTTLIDFASIYGIKPETIEVTYQGVDPLYFKTPDRAQALAFRKKYNLKRNYILYTGGLKRHKNLRMLIKSFTILVNEHKFKGDLCIVGSMRNNMPVSSPLYYSTSDLEKYARLKKVSDQIKFIGFVPQKDMGLFYHQAECFISLSLYEGFGLPVVEAMTSGCPVVASDLGAYPEICGGAAVLVYPYGAHSIARHLNEIITNPNLKQELISKGKDRSKFFNPINIAKRVLEVYKEEFDDYKNKFQP